MRRTILSVLMTILLSLVSCSGTNPTSSPTDNPLVPPANQSINPSAGHHLFGMWQLVFDFDNETAEAIPLRTADGHFNVRKFLENGPCYNCLNLLNFHVEPDNTFFIDVRFNHPFPGLDNFSGFDVRGIAIFNGSYNFPASGLIMSDRTLGDMELLNADGFTTLFNPVDFPEGTGIPILTYNKGRAATPLAQPSTLNAFKSFYTDIQRRLFRSGESDTRTYHIARPAGTLIRVGYAVDASWEPPLTKPVNDPLTEFGPNANCLEAYEISAQVGSGLMPGCGFAPYIVDVYDHQGHDTIRGITFEAPDLMEGIFSDDDGTDMGDFTRYTGTIPNELKADEGEYPILIGATDIYPDYFLGELTAYAVATAMVERVPIDYANSWRKECRTLDNSNYNPNEVELGTSLSEVWHHQFDIGISYAFESVPSIGSSAVYVSTSAAYNQKIWALDLDSGEEMWSRVIKLIPDAWMYMSTPTVGNCEVYVGGSTVFCFNSEDGEPIWTAPGTEASYTYGGIVVVNDLVILWGTNNTLYAFDALTGGFKWDYTTGDTLGIPGTPAYADGIIYAGDYSGYAFALNIDDGSEIWQVQFPTGGPVSMNKIVAPVVLADGLVWLSSWNCHLYGLDPSDGSTIVDVPLGDQVAESSPAYDGTYLYQPTCFDRVFWQFFEGPYKIMAITTAGDVAWEFPGEDVEAFFASPVVANGTVYAASDTGAIHFLDPATGDEVGPGTYMLDNAVFGGISIQDGRLYAMDGGGKVYCLANE
jgi:outer membrane protein assembly factor BamB